MNQAVNTFNKNLTTPIEQMNLIFAQRGETHSFIESQVVTYPYHVGRCLYFPDDPPQLCSVYIQSCSGGLFDGDAWQSRVKIRSQAKVHLTTSASTIIHRCDYHLAQQIQYFDVEEKAYLEYIPMSNILFPQSKFESKIQINMHQHSTVCIFDSFQISGINEDHRPCDYFCSEIDFTINNETKIKERFVVDADIMSSKQWGFNADYTCFGSFYMIGYINHPEEFVISVNELNGSTDSYIGSNFLQESSAVVIRLISKDAVNFHKMKFEIFKQWRKNQFDTEVLRMRK